ncbi:phosphoribosyl-ATP pyrophosphohydrolase [Mesobacillus sp. LC4]
MPIYNKLVRDRIPEIINDTGVKFSSKILDQDEFLIELRKKAYEECKEYLNTETKEEAIEELADILEIIHSLAKSHGSSYDEIENVRKEKVRKRGAFNNKIFLIEVEGE